MDNRMETEGQVRKEMDSLSEQSTGSGTMESKLGDMELLLRESEDKYRTLIEESIHGILIIQDSIIKYANRAMRENFGCQDESEIIGHEFVEFVSSNYRELVSEKLLIQEEDKKPVINCEYIALRKDGAEFEAELSLHIISYQGATALQGIVRDITEDKRILGEAEKSKEMFDELGLRALLLDNATDMITLRDMDGNIVYANEKASNICGYSREELLNMTVHQLTFTDRRESIAEMTRELMEVGENKCESLMKRKDGSAVSMELTHRMIDVGGQQYVLSVGRDTSERKAMEEELKLRAQLLDSTTDSIFLHDIDGTIYYLNEAAYRSRGYTREELLRMNFLKLVIPEYAKYSKSILRDLLKKGEIVFESAHYRKGGSILPVEVYARVIETNGKKLILRVDRDISARRKIEEELKLKAQLLDQTNDEVIVRDIDGIIIYANEAACKSHGYNRNELVGMNIRQLVPSEVSEQIGQRTKEILEKGHKLYESTRMRRDGSVIPVELNSTAFEVGGRKYIISISRDTSERKMMEDELKLKAQLLDNAYDFIFARDQDGNLIYVNELACQALGYTKEEITKLGLPEILSQQNRDELARKTEELFKEGEKELEIVLIRKDGTQIPAEARSRVVTLNNRKYIISVSRDITERKKIEDELKLRAYMLDNAKDSIFVYDREGNMVYVNKEAYESRGYTREELMGMNIRNLTPPSKRALLEKRLTEWPKQGYSFFEGVHVRKDGSEIPVEIYARYIEIGDRKLLVSIARDISERKRIDEERHDLEQRAQFSSHLASIGELAAGVAHEINNPLTAVVGYAQLLMQKDLPEDIIRDLKNISEGAKRVADIVSRLLTFAQRRRLERAYANINEIVETTLSLRNYELKTSGIEVTTQYDPDLQWTVVDVGQLQQVFLNLIMNAETEMKLAHKGGKLHISTQQENGFVRVSFKDNGPGIAKENLDKVFNPFFTTREVGQGTGLGLSVCHGIIKEHGGTIYVKSTPGKGATFIVELPVVTEPRQLELAESEPEVVDTVKGVRVLVIDDEPMVGELLTEWLTAKGHRVEVIDNAQRAITMLRDTKYSLILLDIKMPGMSGIELYNYIRKEMPSLVERIIFITGDVIGYDTQRFLLSTKARYITKPFDYEYFKKVIQKVLAQN
jgi:PAS domain S-box-containing protein